MKQKIAELLGEAGMKYPWIEKLDLVSNISCILIFRIDCCLGIGLKGQYRYPDDFYGNLGPYEKLALFP